MDYKFLENWRITSNLTGNLNKGNYIVSFDSNNDETNSALPYSHFLMIKSSASIDDVRRNIRYIIFNTWRHFVFLFMEIMHLTKC